MSPPPQTHYIDVFDTREVERLQELCNKSIQDLIEACETCAAALEEEPTMIEASNEPGR